MSGIGNLPVVSPIQVAATANIKATGGVMLGVFVSSSTSGTLAFYDSATTTTSTPVVPVFSATAGTWYPLPFGFSSGLYVVVGGTLTATVGLL